MSVTARLVEGFGSRVKAARTALGMTQAELAEKMGVSRVTIANIELSNTGCTLPVLIDLCRELCVSSDWLLGIGEANVDELRRRLDTLKARLRQHAQELERMGRAE